VVLAVGLMQWPVASPAVAEAPVGKKPLAKAPVTKRPVAKTPVTASRFRGFPPETVEFYERLTADNTRAFWNEHKTDYERYVREPMELLAAELAPEFGPIHLFRPHRDVRFSSDKTPFKTHQGGVTEGEAGEVYYCHVSAEELLAVSGYYMMARDQLERFRAAAAADRSGRLLEDVVAATETAGLTVSGGDELKTAPRGYPKDHPRIRFLRMKGLTAGRRWPPRRWWDSREVVERIASTWRASRPMSEWLGRYVGPSELPPADPR
jgi:uncharacterized protein (TIGR02453 family)